MLAITAQGQIFMDDEDMVTTRIYQEDGQPPIIPIHEVEWDQFMEVNYVDLSGGICYLLMFAGVYEKGKQLNKKERK